MAYLDDNNVLVPDDMAGFWDKLWGGIKTGAATASDIHQMQKQQEALAKGAGAPGVPAAVPYQEGFMQKYGKLLMIGGAGLVVVFLLMRRKKD